jgi:hypothetical protein
VSPGDIRTRREFCHACERWTLQWCEVLSVNTGGVRLCATEWRCTDLKCGGWSE